ncbi:MAG: DoxX family protein [Aliihoeflea sp.]
MARIAFGLFFAGSALLKLGATDTMVTMLSGAGFERPLPFVYLASVAQMAAGAALVSGRLVRPAAFGLIAYVAVVNWYLHPYWVLDGEAASIQFQLFTKNLGIMAGLLAVAGAHYGTRQD